MEVTLFDITGGYAHVHIKLYFQIVKVEGDTAYTRFKGHELLRDYIDLSFKDITGREPVDVDILVRKSREGTRLWTVSVTVAGMSVSKRTVNHRIHHRKKQTNTKSRA